VVDGAGSRDRIRAKQLLVPVSIEISAVACVIGRYSACTCARAMVQERRCPLANRMGAIGGQVDELMDSRSALVRKSCPMR
jgi:hypothetical protein